MEGEVRERNQYGAPRGSHKPIDQAKSRKKGLKVTRIKNRRNALLHITVGRVDLASAMELTNWSFSVMTFHECQAQ